MKINLIKDFIVYILIYFLPLLVFWKLSLNKSRKKITLLVISILYIAFSIFTQNLLPFILILICIRYLKYDIELYDDYYKYNFGFKDLNFIKALKYSIFSYMLTLIIATLALSFFSVFKVPLKEQEIVTIMAKLPLKKFIIMMPVTIIFAPVVEEFIFRWLLFEKVFKDKVGIYLSAFITSLIFSIVHFNIKSFPAIFWIGLFNCFLINKKGYWYAVINHSIFNSISTFVLLFGKLGIINI
ncbi:membrane protease YdiL (CAAX protease family) [Clostridium tetanomorphum]|nr:CPBP family intramembrane glutamic endopeptidase [Clostridium tetanomorphum]KAJ51342.1 protease [Clostridium tetanomorphum DSM 665]MBP1866007.1 membrane protease YdiL (CAAX protease family) [Clostridium tetanomorphum]NRS85939.1 membrane protease YdiL (CAAX protease family) [Clostridium tetanomorphum]NRZ96051.1 membrane protease YdiL (CAAX protease family) [Clostridium tetanomorphum]SQB89838.1 protease [Clostridium tetanomorphum]